MCFIRFIRLPYSYSGNVEKLVCSVLLSVMGIGLASLPLTAAQAALHATERSKQKSIAEAESAALHAKLSKLKQEINQTSSAKESAADTLAQSEQAISNANRNLRNLAQEQSQTESKLKGLLKQHAELSNLIQLQQKKLAKLLREQYVAGNEDRMKYLLSGDNPNRINRELQYMTYVSQAQAKWVDSLRSNLQEIEINQAKTHDAQEALKEIVQEKREQKTILENEKTKRSALLSKLSNKLDAQRKEAGNLERDEQRLTRLVEKLAKLEEQAKIEAANKEKRRLQQLAEAKRKKDKKDQVIKTTKNTNHTDKKIKERSQTIQNQSQTELADNDANSSKDNIEVVGIEKNVQEAEQAFARLRGQLKLPVRGTLTARYGSRHVDGMSGKGIFIRAAEGTEIKSVAGGKVVFSDWLRGFGNLIIVDHGSQYLSIYGNNHTLFKRAGEVVKTGDVIASAGSSGGNEQSGLYFELRHQGRAFDPLTWAAGNK